MNVTEFKQSVGQLVRDGELKLAVKTKHKGFEVKVIEYQLMDHLNQGTWEPTGETEEFNTVLMTFRTNAKGVITVIEHPYLIFTSINASEAAFVTSFVGQSIEGLSVDLSDY